jgi:DNA-directed RNA polymerase subunit RPC12/RpoP
MNKRIIWFAQWFCMRCEASFPGMQLFEDYGAVDEKTMLPPDIDMAKYTMRCPTCGSETIVIPERDEPVDD